MNFWDIRFAEPGYKYGTEPNAFLREHAAGWSGSRSVLLPGDGEGRNGVWLAQQGHQVTTVDNSSVGLVKAQKLAKQRGVLISTWLADLEHWAPEANSADVVVLIYTHLPSRIRSEVHRRLHVALRPGGTVLVEAFHPDQLAHSSGGPKELDMLVTPEMLDADFNGLLTPALSWHGEISLSEGPGHQGVAHVTRWVGQLV